MMKRLAVVLFVLSITMLVCAQDAPKAEVFGGYQFTSFDSKDAFTVFGASGRQSLHGFNADFGLNLRKNISVVADFGTGFKTIPTTIELVPVDVKVKLYPILFGPRFSVRSGKVTPFAEALAGFAHLSLGASALGTSYSESRNKFAMAFGGGLDVNATDRIAIRLAKFDYLMVRFTENVGGVDLSETLNNLRLSTGIVFKF